jgi:putative membrane protein
VPDSPYCGSPPIPGSLTWNGDPVLWAALAAFVVLFLLTRTTPQQKTYFISGWLVLTLSLVSPICRLSVALFSAREVQHVLISVIAAPLFALGLRPLLPRRAPRATAIAIIFALVLWLWHVPVLYELTFTSNIVYWTMHATMIFSSIVLWWSILDPTRPGATLVSAFLTMMQMSLLGALLTFGSTGIYRVHNGTTQAWGFSPLEDQQLGGLIMWIPTTLVFLLITLYNVAVLVRSPQALNKLTI